jgi:SAM-dependent methyltransferase
VERGVFPEAMILRLRCPACSGEVEEKDAGIECRTCGRIYPVEDGLLRMYCPNDWETSKADVTETIKAFYEETPFPNYEDSDTVWSLREKAEKGVFARLLDEQIGGGASILEAGCGTGQLSNFLGIRKNRAVFGADICLNSLRLANEFKARNGLDNVRFLQMNLFRPVFAPESFDVVISNGVLHHTSDPFLGFRTIARLVKPGGWIIIGLYNTYGRLIFRLTRDRFTNLDPRLRRTKISAVRKKTWFFDQYKNPHESKHTIGEVQGWFEECGFDFLNGLPHVEAFSPFKSDESLFDQRPKGSRLDHAIVQLQWLLTGGAEGGFFTMIGRRQ